MRFAQFHGFKNKEILKMKMSTYYTYANESR